MIIISASVIILGLIGIGHTLKPSVIKPLMSPIEEKKYDLMSFNPITNTYLIVQIKRKPYHAINARSTETLPQCQGNKTVQRI